jgi:hypothetical protein
MTGLICLAQAIQDGGSMAEQLPMCQLTASHVVAFRLFAGLVFQLSAPSVEKSKN